MSRLVALQLQPLRVGEAISNGIRQNRLQALQKRQFDMQERRLDMQDQQFSDQRNERQRMIEGRFFGGLAEMLAQAPPEQAQSLYEQGLVMARDRYQMDINDAPQQYTPELGQQMLLQAQTYGFKPTAPELTSDIRTMNALSEGLSEEDKLKARRIELGLEPRAGISSQERIANNPGLASRVAESQGQIEGSKSSEKTRAKEKEQRTDDLIERGILAAESTAVLRRGLTLIDFIDTGGIDAAALRIKQVFGVEGADEGELSANLGKAVLSQLRETFGAQFTQREGDRLQRIEAGFGKSTAANKRLLQQALSIAERTSNRAIKAAEEIGDTSAASDIRELLKFTLDPPPEGATDNGDGTLGGQFTSSSGISFTVE